MKPGILTKIGATILFQSFEAHTSVMTPKLPPTYHPKFNVICKPKGPGSNAYGKWKL